MVVNTKFILGWLMIVVLVAPLFFYSCKSVERTITSSSDSTLVCYDTIIQIKERSDTFYSNSILVRDTIIKNGNKSQLKIKVIENNKVQFICNEDEYKLKLDSVIQLKSVRTKVVETITIEKCTNAWHDFYKKFFEVLVTIIVLAIIIKSAMR